MKDDKRSTSPALVELGVASVETRGNEGIYWEATGLRPFVGLSDD